MAEKLLVPVQTQITELPQTGSLYGQTCRVTFGDGTQFHEVQIKDEAGLVVDPVRYLEQVDGSKEQEPNVDALSYPATAQVRHDLGVIALDHFDAVGELPAGLKR
jgi:hypothetical protein